MNVRLASRYPGSALLLVSLLVCHIESRTSFADNGFRGMANFPTLQAIQSAAESGEAKAQRKLGDFYFSRAEFTNAVALYRKAADQGEIEAQLSLSSCYRTGRGVARDPREATRWSRIAAAQGGKTKLAPHSISSPVAATAGAAPPAFVESQARASSAIRPLSEIEGTCRIRRVSTLLFVEAELDFVPGEIRSCLEIP